jgi:Type II secretion system (T2SS), protein M subtype b
MNQEQSINDRALPGRQQIRVRFDQLKRSRQLSMIGGAELIGLICAVLLALLTVFLYLYLFLPARSRLNSAQLERDRLQGQWRASEDSFKEISTAKETVDRINASLNDFESNWLIAPTGGRMTLYTELNDLIRSNGLRNTSGPAYSALEPLGTKPQVQATAGAQSNAKWQSVYPGIAVSVTVEGPYQNVRHFVRDIETSRQFLVINAVELEGVTQNTGGQLPGATDIRTPPPRTGRAPAGAASGAGPATPLAGQRGAMVSLRLDMSTYFQRAVNP